MSPPQQRDSGATVADVMIREPKLCDSTVTVGEVRELFSDDHMHAVLLVRNKRLLSVIERGDIPLCAPATAQASPLGRRGDRVISAGAPVELAYQQLRGGGRRLAVVDEIGDLIGLVCLKRSRTGFCTERDIRDRASERAARAAAESPPRPTVLLPAS